MKIEETKIQGCFLLTPTVFKDNRGAFLETYNKEEFELISRQEIQFVQDNQSISKKGVLRGMHFQTGKYAQSKLVKVVQGAILDVVVDLRPDSKSFGEHYMVELNAESHKTLFIPKGIAHGFLTLSDTAIFQYKCDAYYNSQSEGGIIYNDSDLNIDWPISAENLILSEKDLQLPSFKSLQL